VRICECLCYTMCFKNMEKKEKITLFTSQLTVTATERKLRKREREFRKQREQKTIRKPRPTREKNKTIPNRSSAQPGARGGGKPAPKPLNPAQHCPGAPSDSARAELESAQSLRRRSRSGRVIVRQRGRRGMGSVDGESERIHAGELADLDAFGLLNSIMRARRLGAV
jgi:hypothetical protein